MAYMVAKRCQYFRVGIADNELIVKIGLVVQT